MNIATLEQRNIIDAYSRSLQRERSPLMQRIKQARQAAPTLRASLTVVLYLFIFAICFQASRNDFSTHSAAYLSQANGGKATQQQGFSAPRSAQAAAPQRAAAAPAQADSAVTTLPATDQPSTAGPSQGVQFTATGYAYGQCTWYVSHRRPLPQNWGNARDWVLNAKAAGFTTGAHARPGAIGQTTAGRYGHVVYVEQVQDGKVYVSEMNYVGWNRLTYRWANESDFSYIY